MSGSKLKTRTEGKKLSRSTIGAPSQRAQSSRKGRRAWRKNVDIDDVEQGLESIRSEERVTGVALQKTTDKDLFQIDLKGDHQARKSLRRFSVAELTSTKILARRSAVPAVLSRIQKKSRKSYLSGEDKEQLLRIAKRPSQGPSNSTVTGLSEAVKQSGGYDAWALEPPEVEMEHGLEAVQKMVPKAPLVMKPLGLINLPAVADPHQGASYNPAADAHHELLLQAASVEGKRVSDAEKLASVKHKMDAARTTTDYSEVAEGPAGMKVQEVVDDNEENGVDVHVESNSALNKPSQKKKTKSQRAKERRLLAERHALAERVKLRRQLASVDGAKSIRRATTRLMSQRERLQEQRRLAIVEKLQKQGFAGTKIGKYKVPEADLDVQLCDNLTDSLRGLKVEGNLFRDRFESLQRRALIEPRIRVLPTKRKRQVIEYEKHAWKRFM